MVWIVEKGGISRIPEHHVRKAQFILHLRQVLKLNSVRISRSYSLRNLRTRSTIMISTGSSQRQGFE